MRPGRDQRRGRRARDPAALRRLDAVAYLRFASVYRHYDTVDDFEHAIAELRGGLQTV